MKKSDQKIVDTVQAGKCTISIVTPKAGESPEASQARVIAENPANALIARLMGDFSDGGFDDPGEDSEY